MKYQKLILALVAGVGMATPANAATTHQACGINGCVQIVEGQNGGHAGRVVGYNGNKAGFAGKYGTGGVAGSNINGTRQGGYKLPGQSRVKVR